MTHRFGSTHAGLEVIPLAARLALECIGNSDALYHNVEHTMLVTLAGYDIMRGRALLMPTDANDFAHLILVCFTTSAMFAVFSKATAQMVMLSMERVAKSSFRAVPRTRRVCPTTSIARSFL